MVLEIVLVILLIATILVFFYRQAVQEFRIVQTDSFEKVPGLLHERCPIVVHPFTNPLDLWTYKDIEQRKKLSNIPIQREEHGPIALGSLMTKKNVYIPLSKETNRSLAEQVGLDVWVKHEVLPVFSQSTIFGSLYTITTEARIGSQGLEQTYAHATILLATEGTLHVSLLTESSEPFLPKPWLNQRLSKMTRDDTPLIGQIQTVEVIVRPGTALVIPPHWRICWDDEGQPSLAVLIELHHPVSRIVQHIENNRLHISKN